MSEENENYDFSDLEAECAQYKKEIENAEKKFPDVKAILGDFPDPELKWEKDM